MKRLCFVLVAMLLFPTLGSAQIRASAPLTRPNVSVMSIDPTKAAIGQLQSRVRSLQSQVSTLQAQLRDMGAAQVSYRCLDPVTSTNNKGVTEDCTPFGCNAIDGRCRTQCTSTDHCGGGAVCNIPERMCYGQ